MLAEYNIYMYVICGKIVSKTVYIALSRSNVLVFLVVDAVFVGDLRC